MNLLYLDIDVQPLTKQILVKEGVTLVEEVERWLVFCSKYFEYYFEAINVSFSVKAMFNTSL